MRTLPMGLSSPFGQTGVTAADLHSMGKTASAEYLGGHSTLNDSIVKLAQSRPYMNQNHVQRVVEMANQETFARLFSKEASDKNVEFDLADPKVVMAELNYGTVKEAYNLDDYSVAPAGAGSAEVKAAEDDAILMEAFGVPGHEKSASLVKVAKIQNTSIQASSEKTAGVSTNALTGESGYEKAEPYRELIVMKQKTARMLDDISFARDKNERMVKEAQANFNYHATQHVSDGGKLSEVAYLMEGLDYGLDMAKAAMKDLVTGLEGQGYDLLNARAEDIQFEMTKKAHRMVNPSNPVVQSLADLKKLAEGQPILEEAHTKVANEYHKLQEAVSKAMVDSGVFQ